MTEKQINTEEAELNAAIESVLGSPSLKKLVIAGPGTGKTTLFKHLLKLETGDPNRRIVLTFINNLKNDLEEDLKGLARVFTLHSYCLGLLYKNSRLRSRLSSGFRCYPGLASIIARDWELIEESEAPKFVGEMRNLMKTDHISFYIERGDYYDAVDFDDTVYRAYVGLVSGRATLGKYDLVLVDEYQDFNRLEAGFIDELSKNNSILIAGDDDQALYSQLRNASWDHIRMLNSVGEYEVFKLPFCMRCPKVVVDAVSDVIIKAREINKLEGRIDKPYKHFPPVKGADSTKYPKIINVETSVQRQSANYMGRYIVQAIREIPSDEIQEAAHSGYPTVLVIVAKPYRRQIISHLESEGYILYMTPEVLGEVDRDLGLSILKEDRESNLGWRIILESDKPPFLKEKVIATADCTKRLVELLPSKFCEEVLSEVELYKKDEKKSQSLKETSEVVEKPLVRITSFEGAKGLSAQHVFIAGLHNGELPHNERDIKDLEICKFIVGLTRTRKKCTLIHTRNFGGVWKNPSSFISWIHANRLEQVRVDKEYFK